MLQASLFTERTLKLKRLAKMLGFVLFSPFWPEPDSESPALREGRSLTISQLSAVSPPVDVLTLLQRAVNERTVVLVVPWLVELLKMQRDSVTRSSLYYRQVYSALCELYHSTHREQIKIHKHRASAVAMVVLSEVEALFDFLMLPLHSQSTKEPDIERQQQSASRASSSRVRLFDAAPAAEPELHSQSAVPAAKAEGREIPVLISRSGTPPLQPATPPRTPVLAAAESPPGTPIRPGAPQTPTGLTPGRRGLPGQIVDQSDSLVTELYIEHCSPFLDEVRRLLCKSIKSTKLTRSASARLRPHATARNAQAPEKPRGAQLRLLSTVLRQYPQLRRLVDFVAESCTENACVASSQVDPYTQLLACQFADHVVVVRSWSGW